ncbi:MAG: protein kinase [Acidobacteriia bacterium]|nr:protein kinase [Terriglobia bacterium]
MADLPKGKVIDGKYKVQSKLGSGDAGTVYRVTQQGINVDRAMKVLDPKLSSVSAEAFRREFAAERQKLSLLTHKNLVKLIDAGDFDDRGTRHPYYVTDLVHPRKEGGAPPTLVEWAKEVTSRAKFVNILLQLTDGLSYLHSHQCLHCDIKPKNVLLEYVSGDVVHPARTGQGS